MQSVTGASWFKWHCRSFFTTRIVLAMFVSPMQWPSALRWARRWSLLGRMARYTGPHFTRALCYWVFLIFSVFNNVFSCKAIHSRSPPWGIFIQGTLDMVATTFESPDFYKQSRVDVARDFAMWRSSQGCRDFVIISIWMIFGPKWW